MIALVKTFFDDDFNVEAELVSVSEMGLCKVKMGERTFARHRNRITPLNEEAMRMLQVVKK